MLEIHRTKKLNSGNRFINLINHCGIVAFPYSHHFQTLRGHSTLPHSKCDQAQNQAPVRPNNNRVIGHRGKHMVASKKVMKDLKCSPISNSRDKRCHLQVHHQCPQDHMETIQSFGRHLPAPLHKYNVPGHLGDHQSVAHSNNSGLPWNCSEQMLLGLPICPHVHRFLMTNVMQVRWAMSHMTWVLPKEKPKTAWSTLNSPWSNLTKGWGSPHQQQI